MSEKESTPSVPERPLVLRERVWLRPLEPRDMQAYGAGINDELGDDRFIGTTWFKEVNRLDGNAELAG